jgi:beta-lactam-binding protein with PASTA domain
MRTRALVLWIGLALVGAPAALAASDVVPDVVGLDMERALTMLDTAGCKVSVAFRADAPEGRVVSQEPGGLGPRDPSGVVHVIVGGKDDALPPAPSSPSRPVAPRDYDRPPTPADPPPDDGPPAGPVPSMPDEEPPAGPAPAVPGPGAEPPLTPSAGAAPTGPAAQIPADLAALPAKRGLNREGPALPSALNLSVAEAQQALRGWRVLVEQTISLPDLVGRVVNQAPVPGEALAQGETVVVVVAGADAPSPEHRSVPPLVGLPMDQAVLALTRAGFQPALVTVPSAMARLRRVVSQRPLDGSLAPAGSAVEVRIGRGTGTEPAAPPPGPEPAAPEPAAPPAVPIGPTEPVEPGPPAGSGPEVPDVAPPVEPPPETAVQPPEEPRATFGSPTLISPSEGQSFPRAYGSTFQWTPLPQAKAYEWVLEQEDGQGGWKPLAQETVEGTRHRPNRMDRGRFRWRVRGLAENAVGEWSDWFRLYMY